MTAKTTTDPTKPDVSALAKLISAHTPYAGIFELRVPSVHVIKVSWPSTHPTHALQHPSVCIVAQGAKSVMVGEEVYGYEAAQIAVYSVDIPVAAQITRASQRLTGRSAPTLDRQIANVPRTARVPCAARKPHKVPHR